MLPEVAHFRILHGLEELRPKMHLHQEPAEVEECSAMCALENRQGGIPQNRSHLIAPSCGEAAEDRHEVRRQQILFHLGTGGEHVESNRVVLVGWVEEDHVLDSILGQMFEDAIHQVAVRIKKSAAIALANVLENAVEEEGGFACAACS